MGHPIPIALESGSMYEAERKIHPRDVKGRYATLRLLAVFMLLGAYYVAPWITWNGRQAVLFDLPARKFHVLGLSFWPQDFVFLALLLIIAALSLFFFTALAGRLWCGYACPQTVWTEVFLRIERWTEGDRAQRIKLDAAPWSASKWRRKGAKHALWLLLALWTGFTFVGFFTPIRDLGARLYPLDWSGWETFWVLFYAFATWGNAGVLREQVCKYMCPYARFQSAMFDRNTLIIAYDPLRGEPRGSRRRGLGSVLQRVRGLLAPAEAERWLRHAQRIGGVADRALHARRTTAAFDLRPGEADETLPLPSPSGEALGDCIDCTVCVQVCPTGIDIRNGLQYECIACGACIDACDGVMDKVGYPRGLIRYTTQNAMDGRRTRLLRARTAIYAVLLLVLCAGWVVGVALRAPLRIDVLRDRNALYRVATDGAIENGYSLKLVNRLDHPRRLSLRLREAGPVVLAGPLGEFEAAAEQVLTVPVTLRAPSGTAGGRRVLLLEVIPADSDAAPVEVEIAFFGPPA
jgi:polyferredoxin